MDMGLGCADQTDNMMQYGSSAFLVKKKHNMSY